MAGVVDDSHNQAGDSTSADLSSPPSGNSPAQPATLLSNDLSTKHGAIHLSLGNGAINDGGKETANKIRANDLAAPRRQRRKPDGKTPINNAASANGEERPRKTRVPRGTGPQAMKKKAEQERKAREAAEAMQVNNHSRIPDRVLGATPPPTNAKLPHTSPHPQNGNHEAIPTQHHYNHQSLTPQPRTFSGQNYDPIRSSTVAPRPTTPMNIISSPPKILSTTQATHSPSISSLIDPPDTTRPSAYAYAPRRESEYRPASPPGPKRPRLSTPPSAPPAPPEKFSFANDAVVFSQDASKSTAMDIDNASAIPAQFRSTAVSKKPTPNASKGPSPGPHSPKPTRPKEAPPLPTGSGLLSGSVFGGSGSLDGSAPEKTAPTVIIHVPLTGENQYINFTRLAEEKYGFNALHPRLAAQRERLARVAAAGAALENAHKNGGSNAMSADEMSVDLSNDEGDNSNVEMGGADDRGGNAGIKSGEDTGEAPKRRKRVMKEDMYDKDDDFVDDTELAWEEQAAVSKDGFFVYSGPLVPEGEEAKVERYVTSCLGRSNSRALTINRADSAPKRGRASAKTRGGGAVSRRGAAATAGAGKETGKDAKPAQKRQRRSKVEIERAEREKAAQKESLAVLASKPTAHPSGPMQQQWQQQQMQQMQRMST